MVAKLIKINTNRGIPYNYCQFTEYIPMFWGIMKQKQYIYIYIVISMEIFTPYSKSLPETENRKKCLLDFPKDKQIIP